MESIENPQTQLSSPLLLVPRNPFPRAVRETLPTMYDLPSEDPEEPGLPDEFHFLQPILLMLGFLPVGWESDRIFCTGDMNLYYDPENTRRYKRPDWLGAVGIPRLYDGWDLRLSYVTWQEEANPFVVIELLSPGTEEEDLGETEATTIPTKWEVYEQILKIPYYFVFSRYTNQLQGFRLTKKGKYEEMKLRGGRLQVPELGLSLGVWQGKFRGQQRAWLRWLTLAGELIPTPEERAALAEEQAALAEEQVALAEEQAALAEEQVALAEERAGLAEEREAAAQRRAEELAARLRELGIDPDEV